VGLIITRAHRPLNPGQQLRKRAMLSASIDLSCGCRAFGSAGQNSQNRRLVWIRGMWAGLA